MEEGEFPEELFLSVWIYFMPYDGREVRNSGYIVDNNLGKKKDNPEAISNSKTTSFWET